MKPILDQSSLWFLRTCDFERPRGPEKHGSYAFIQWLNPVKHLELDLVPNVSKLGQVNVFLNLLTSFLEVYKFNDFPCLVNRKKHTFKCEWNLEAFKSLSYLMSSSVTTKALQSGCAVFSHTPGFFSTAAVSCPVMGTGLVCRELAMAESSVLSEQTGPTPRETKRRGLVDDCVKRRPISVLLLPCRPLGRSIDFTGSSAISNAFKPLSFLSQNN